MVDKNSSPAFSLGSSKRSLIKDNGMPGPGSYAHFSSIKTSQGLTKYKNFYNLELLSNRDFQNMIHLYLDLVLIKIKVYIFL